MDVGAETTLTFGNRCVGDEGETAGAGGRGETAPPVSASHSSLLPLFLYYFLRTALLGQLFGKLPVADRAPGGIQMCVFCTCIATSQPAVTACRGPHA